MGEWNQTCGLTGTPIRPREKIVCYIIASPIHSGIAIPMATEMMTEGPWDGQEPLGLPIRARYNGTGGINGVEEKDIIDGYNRQFLMKLPLRTIGNMEYECQHVYGLLNDILEEGATLKTPQATLWLHVWMAHEDAYENMIKNTRRRLTTYEENGNASRSTFEKVIRSAISKWAEECGRKKSERSLFGCGADASLLPTYLENHDFIGQVLWPKLLDDHYATPAIKQAIIERISLHRLMFGLRRGFLTRCGAGSQDYDTYAQMMLAGWIQKKAMCAQLEDTDTGYKIYSI